MKFTIEQLVYQDWKKKIKWDVTHEEALERVEADVFCFDPLLSYETTGYRPLTETLGLDFDPLPFKEVGLTRLQQGTYTQLIPGSKKHVDWWKEQLDLSDNGISINNYRITGDHYFFLNFYTMLVQQAGARAGSGRKHTHPDFWAIHYEWFHYIELAEILGYDCAGLKGRGVGFSEIGACLGVRPYTTTPDYNAVYVASYEPYLTGKGILQKCWNQLDWLNQNTEGGMKRLRQKINQDLHKRASKQSKGGEESGHMAQISGQTVDKPDKLRGDRAERLIFEESGSNNVLLGTYAVSEALVIINGERLGIRVLFGTGGDTEEIQGKNGKSKSGLHGLETIFLNPKSFKVLPYRHKYNTNEQFVETGFFLPSWRTVLRAMDNRGVVNEVEAKAYYLKIRDKLRVVPESYLKHCAEYCFTYEEALSRKGQNDFDQIALANQRIDIEMLEKTPRPKIGHIAWRYKHDSSEVSGVKFTEHPTGNVHIIEEPVLENGLPIRNLYVAGIDSIDQGVNDSATGAAGSKFAIVIKKRSFGLDGDKYVAYYMDRPMDIREAYEKARMLLHWYNCQANIEYTKITAITYFREKGDIRLLMNRPKYALEGQTTNRGLSNMIGTQANERMIRYGLDLIRDYIMDYCHLMYFLEMVKQCQEYSYEMKGKYDLIAAMQMCEIGDQELMGIVPKKQVKEEWDDVGYYTDSNGYKKYGVIPKKQNYGPRHFLNQQG